MITCKAYETYSAPKSLGVRHRLRSKIYYSEHKKYLQLIFKCFYRLLLASTKPSKYL